MLLKGVFIMQDLTNFQAIDNVIEKLQLHIQRTKQSMHELANKLDFGYQPFFRLMTKKNLPTVSALDSIAKILNCTISELTSNNAFLDVPAYNSIDDFQKEKSIGSVRVYLAKSILNQFLHDELIAIKASLATQSVAYKLNDIAYISNENLYQLFKVSNELASEKLFVVNHENQIKLMEFSTVTNEMIITIVNDAEVRIPIGDISIIAKFIGYVELPSIATQQVFQGSLVN